MRLAQRFRPMRWNKTIRVNTKKAQKLVRENHAVLAALAAEDAPKAKKAPAKKAAAKKADAE